MTAENNYIVYALQSPNGKLYVGQTNDYDKRMSLHKSESSKCRYIRNAIQKHGWENIKQFVLIEGLVVEQANFWETHYIKIFDCIAPSGYNLRSGGDNYEVSQITRDRMSAATKKKFVDPEFKARHKAALDTPEYRAKLSEAKMGNTNAKGCKHPPRTDEARAKNSAAANKHEHKVSARLSAQLQHYEKRLEKTGLLQ